MGLQSCKSPNFGNFGTFNWKVPGQNDIWVHAPWLNIENIIRGKVVASPSLGCGEFCESCEFMFAHGLSVHQKCSNYALTNLLFGLCKFLWIVDMLVTHPISHPEVPTHPSTPEVLQVKECTQLFILALFSPWTRNWISQGTWGCIITCVCFYRCLHCLGQHATSGWLHFWFHPWGAEGLLLPCTLPFSLSPSKCLGCSYFGNNFLHPKLLPP